jgi:hypothetical protein
MPLPVGCQPETAAEAAVSRFPDPASCPRLDPELQTAPAVDGVQRLVYSSRIHSDWQVRKTQLLFYDKASIPLPHLTANTTRSSHVAARQSAGSLFRSLCTSDTQRCSRCRSAGDWSKPIHRGKGIFSRYATVLRRFLPCTDHHRRPV